MKKIILLLAIVLTIKNYGQNEIKLSIYQDLKLAVKKDGKGNEPFTLDLLTKLKLTGNQDKNGYLHVAPMFEYAEIKGIYKRYAVDIGYSFNQLGVDGLEITPSINYGIQERYSKNFLVFGGDIEASYKIIEGISVSALAQFVERKDLLWLYGKKPIRFSGFLGLTIKIK